MADEAPTVDERPDAIVIQFADLADKVARHSRCGACRKRWLAVVPREEVGHPHRCPRCGLDRGVELPPPEGVATVANLEEEAASGDGWSVGHARCRLCDSSWVATVDARADATKLECPACEAQDSVFEPLPEYVHDEDGK